MEVVSDVLEEGVEVLLDDLELASQQVSPLDHHVVQGHESGVEFTESFGFGSSVEDFAGFLMQLCAEVAHFVEGIDFLDLQILQSFSLSGQTLIQPFNFWHKPLHFLQVGPSLSIEQHLHLSGFSLHLIDAGIAGLLLTLFFELGELAGLCDPQEAFHVFVVLELTDIHQVVQEVLQNAHAFLHVSFSAFCCLLFRDRRDDLCGVSGP